MFSIRFSLCVVAAMAMLMACKRTGQGEVGLQIARRSAELDRLSWQSGNAGLPPVRILIPVGGHDGNAPAGGRRAFHVPGRALARRIQAAKGRPWPRPDEGSGQNLAASALFWGEQDLPLAILPAWLTPVREASEARPQDPGEADWTANPFPP